MLAVMPGMPISRQATAGRGDYGIDAPPALITIALPGAAAMAAVAVGAALRGDLLAARINSISPSQNHPAQITDGTLTSKAEAA